MAATNPVELRVKRRLMREYLLADHVMITLKRPTIVKTPAGGQKRGLDTTIEPQMFRLYPQVRRMPDMKRDTPDGNITNIRFILVGLYTADVKASDWFIHDGKIYDVEAVWPVMEDRTAANVTYRGPADDQPWNG